MKFVGLKPRLDNYKLPDFLKSKMGVFRASNNAPLPCLINSVSITREHIIPEEPVDSNVFVSDNIITKPLSISLELFIYEQDAEEFYNILNTTQHETNGFRFINRDGIDYSDLFIESLHGTVSYEKLGGFDCVLDFKQVMRVQALKSTIQLSQPKQTPMQNQGTVSAEKLSASAKQEVKDVSVARRLGSKVFPDLLGFGGI